MGSNFYKSGSWKAYCDVCGRPFHADKLRKRWDGLMVCRQDMEPRHPQEFLRAVPDMIPPPWTRPGPGLYDLNVCTFAGMTAYAGYGVAGCMVAGRNPPLSDFTVPT